MKLAAPLLVILAVAAGQRSDSDPTDKPKTSAEKTVVESALVTVIEEAEVPAQVEGILAAVEVREGQMIEAGGIVARIEDAEVRLTHDRAKVEFEIARKQAKNDLKVRLARKSTEVARTELKRAVESVEKYKKSVSETEIDRLRLAAERSELEIDQALHEQESAQLTSQLKEIEMELAKQAVHRRLLVSPIAGMVVQVNLHQGEWVPAGKAAVRMLRVDRLRVECFMQSKKATGDLIGRRVTLAADLGGKTAAEFEGSIVWVSPEVNPVNGQVRVWAEVENPKLLLRPGLRGNLTIHPDAAQTAKRANGRSMTTATHNPAGGAVSGLERRLALRRRQDIVAVPQVFSGQKLWAVKDPVTLRYFHLRDEEFWVWQALDGVSSLAAIQEKFEKQFAPRRLTFMQLQSFLGALHQEGLILADAPGQTRELLKRGRKLKRTKLLGRLSNILALRFRGVDPQRFLDWLLDSCGWLISGWSLAVCLAIVFTAVSLVVTKFDVLQSRLPEFDSFLTPSTVIWLSVALAVTKVLHELGHALTCRYFGAECHELGFMFLVFTPCLYVNVSDSWMIVSKWRRAAIGAAGVGVELVLAGLATLLWWFSEPGLFNTLCFNIMLVGSISTLFFNGNPLLRYDGYYILADLAEIPNLSQTATSVVRESVAEWLLGIPASRDDEYSPGKRLFLAVYAVLSFLYRTLITVSILWLVHRLLKPHQLEAAAFVLACLVLGGMLAFPLWRSVQFVQYAYWSRQMKTRRATVSALLIALALVGISLAPLPHRVSVPVVLEAEDARRVYAPVAGTLLDGASVGAPIEAGQPVALLDNLDLKLEIVRLRGLRDEQKLRLQNLRHRQTHDTKAAAEIPTAEEGLADLEERLARRLEDEKRLMIMAPVAGTVLPGRRKPRNYADKELETWSGLPLDESNRGCFVETGTLLCQIGDPHKFEASLVIDQGDMEFIRAGQEVQIQLDQHPGRLLTGTIREIAEIDLKITPTELLPAGTLPTRPDESGVYRPVGTVYQARVSLEPAEMPLVIGESGRAKVHAAPLSLARRLSRYLSHTFRFEM